MEQTGLGLVSAVYCMLRVVEAIQDLRPVFQTQAWNEDERAMPEPLSQW